MEGQRNDWVRWVASASSGVRGGGSWAFAMVWIGSEGRAEVSAAMRERMDVFW